MQQGKSWSGGERNHLFLGVGGARYVDVSRLSNADCAGDGRSVAVTDWDDDGKLDFVLKSRTAPRVQVFHNRSPQQGRFLAVELRGNADTVPRDAINARVVVEAGGRSLQRTLYGGEGFLAQSSKRLHFGLGDAARVERLTVHWTDGTRTVLEDLAVDQRLRVFQGSDEPEVLEARTTALADVPHRPAEPLTGNARRLVLAFELPLDPLPIPAFDDPERTVADLAGEPLLLNLWRESCAPCLVELGEFGDALRVGGLDVRLVPLTLDGPTAEQRARELLAAKGVDPADAGYLEPHSMAVLMGAIYEHVHPPRNNKPQVTPTSFLLDAEGDLMAIYHGPVEVETLRADLAVLADERPTPVLDRLRHGTRLVHHARDFAALAKVLAELEALVDPTAEPPVTEPVRGRDALAAFYRGVQESLSGYVLRDGERVELRAPAPIAED